MHTDWKMYVGKAAHIVLLDWVKQNKDFLPLPKIQETTDSTI